MGARLDYDTAWDADPKDAWATITLIVVATVLSVRRFQGVDLEFLICDWRTMPEHGWTLLSSTLLHGDWMHLAFNLYWTYRFGVLLEAMFGLERFVLVLLMLAAGSSGAQWALSGAGIGLSGIGYGLFGLLFALDRWHPRCRGVLDRRVAELFGAWFLLCLVATWYKIMPVANVAHASGFLLGAILGWSLAVDSSKRVLRLGALLAGLALIASGLTAPVRHLVNRSDGYAYELFTRGNEAYDAENWERAAALYEGVVARDAEMFEAWYNLGLAYHQLGREDEASFAVTRSAELEALEDARRASERGSIRDFSILRGDGRVEETD